MSAAVGLFLFHRMHSSSLYCLDECIQCLQSFLQYILFRESFASVCPPAKNGFPFRLLSYYFKMWRRIYLEDSEWNAGVYRTCRISHECIDEEYPFECVREMILPGHGCRVGTLGRNNALFRMVYGMKGIDINVNIVNMSASVKMFRCPSCTDSGCFHAWRVEHSYHSISKPAFVTKTMNCLCLSNGRSFNRSWKDIIVTKYETRYIAGCAIAWFIGHKTNYFPKGILEEINSVDSKLDGVKLFYHNSHVGNVEQVLFVQLRHESGGFYITNPLDMSSRLQSKLCFVCKFKNTNQSGSRMMFGLDCGRHALCEKCVFAYFVRKDSDMVSIHSDNKVDWCSHCNVEMNRVIHVSVGSLKELRAPWPIGFLGRKPVFSRSFMTAVYPFFKMHLEWVLSAVTECEKYLDAAKELLVVQHGRRDHEDALSPSEVTHVQKGIDLLIIACDQWELASVWLKFRRGAYAFLMEADTPYPMEFLNQDDEFYMSLLSRKDYELLRNRAICTQWNCYEHFSILDSE